MSNVHCSMGCSRRVYHNAYADQPIGYVICSVCRNNGQFANHAKAAYSLIDKSANEALQKQIQNLKKEKEDCVAQINTFYFHKYFSNGDGLSNFLTEKLADYMQQYNTFVENIKKQQACLKGYITKSVRRITKSIEKAVMGIISNEAETLSSNIEIENKDNERRIKSSEATRDDIKKKLISERIQTSHSQPNEDRKDENPVITEYTYEKSEVEAIVKPLNANVEKYKHNSAVLFSLKAEGEKIAGQLSREDKGQLDLTIDTTIVFENQQPIKLEIKE